jgi:F0F1-type ATP synthase assembly protein I
MERLVGPPEDRRTDLSRGPISARGLKAFQATVQRSGPAAMASYTLIGAIILLGGMGYAIDTWQGTSPWFLFGGLVLGLIVGFYELAKTIWRRS